MPSPSLAGRADALARYAAVLLGFSIPISVALDNILLAAVLLFWLASGGFREKAATIAASKVALGAFALFAILAAALAWGTRNPGDGVSHLVKYLDLAFVPVFVTLFRDARTRELALRCFCAAMVLAFVAAELNMLGLLQGNPWLPRHPQYPGGFKHSITHGLLAAFAALIFGLAAHAQARWPQRLLFAALALVAVKHVYLVAISRTAYLLAALLAIYFFFAVLGKRGLALACLVLAVLFSGAYVGAERFRERVDAAAAEAMRWRSGEPARDAVDLRLEWYRRSLDLVRDHPVLGTGTGSFPRVYAEAAQGTGGARTVNPHNEYLLIAVQTGIVGLALLLHLFWRQLQAAPRLATPFETHLARGLVIAFAAGCLFNSLILDHTEGLFFAWLTGLLYGGLKSPVSSKP